MTEPSRPQTPGEPPLPVQPPGSGGLAERLLAGTASPVLDDLLGRLPSLDHLLDRRIEADEDTVDKGLAQLVLTVVELLRQLIERQALRRVDAGNLSDEQVERLGRTLMALEARMGEVREVFGLAEDDLNLDLGPLGRLL